MVGLFFLAKCVKVAIFVFVHFKIYWDIFLSYSKIWLLSFQSDLRALAVCAWINRMFLDFTMFRYATCFKVELAVYWNCSEHVCWLSVSVPVALQNSTCEGCCFVRLYLRNFIYIPLQFKVQTCFFASELIFFLPKMLRSDEKNDAGIIC